MTFAGINNQKSNETAYFEGKPVKIISRGTDYVFIEDENGRISRVNKDTLKNTPLFSLSGQSEEAKQEREEKIACYQAKAEEARNEKNKMKDQIEYLLSQLKLCNKGDEMYTSLKKELDSAKMGRTAFSNQEYGYCMDAFMVASSIFNWC